MRRLVIGARGSALSLCQTQMVQVRLEERFPGRRFAITPIKSAADKHPDAKITALGGEGVFVKELEAALLGGSIDLAVHSMKDLPLAIPEGLRLGAVTEREDARDAWISRSGEAFSRLPEGSRVGTSSPRRRSQLLFQRPDLEMLDMRGNVDTRLRKLDEGRYDAIVLAACGLARLGLEERVTEYLPLSRVLPEPGQGALGLEMRAQDAEVAELLQALDDVQARACVEAERAFLGALGGGCRLPVAAYGAIEAGRLVLDGSVTRLDGTVQLRDRLEGPPEDPGGLGERLAKALIERGAGELLNAHPAA